MKRLWTEDLVPNSGRMPKSRWPYWATTMTSPMSVAMSRSIPQAVAGSPHAPPGQHVAPGCTVRTTAELLLALLPVHRFSCATDPQTGFLSLSFSPDKTTAQRSLRRKQSLLLLPAQ